MDYDSILQVLTAWAKGCDDVRSIVMTGSAASASAHPLSDRDIELHVRDPERFEHDDSWWRSLGEVLAVERLENGSGQPTRIVYYVDGKIDFTLVDTADERGTYDRPFEVLLDKDGDTAGFRVVGLPAAPPDQDTFDECVNWGYAAAIMIATAIVRDEPWSAKIRDSDLKTELLRTIEWDHGIRYGGARDVRYLGTRMHRWMDADIQLRLEECWAPFDLRETRRALRASLDLFGDIASRVARAADLIDFRHEAARARIDVILASAAEPGSR